MGNTVHGTFFGLERFKDHSGTTLNVSPLPGDDDISTQEKRRLKLTKRLAMGGFGTAYTAVDQDDPSAPPLCVKIPHDPTDESIQREAEVARRVVGYESFAPKVARAEYTSGWIFTSKTTLNSIAIMPFAPHGTLKSMIEEHRITKDNFDDCLKMVVDNLIAIHQAGIVHRDISPDNVLVYGGGDGDLDGDCELETFRLVIADYGVSLTPEARKIGKGYETCGKQGFMAPEVAQGKGATFLSDWYSLGISLQIMGAWVYDDRRFRTSDLYEFPMKLSVSELFQAWSQGSRYFRTLLVSVGFLRWPWARALGLMMRIVFISPLIAPVFCLGAIIAVWLVLEVLAALLFGPFLMAILITLLMLLFEGGASCLSSSTLARTKTELGGQFIMMIAGWLFAPSVLSYLPTAIALCLPPASWALVRDAVKARGRTKPMVARFPHAKQPRVTEAKGMVTRRGTSQHERPIDTYTAKCKACKITFSETPKAWACTECGALTWQDNNDSEDCIRCKKPFALLSRHRHHCRCCGLLICSECEFERKCRLPYHDPVAVYTVCTLCAKTVLDE